MKHFLCIMLGLFSIAMAKVQAQPKNLAPRVKIAEGKIQGIDDSGVYIYKGIPFARPPVGNLRWKPPQPLKKWQGTLKATHFGPRCMQRPGAHIFRSRKMSEDCLYLNVWTPVKPAEMKKKHLPVLVYFYGGGFWAGDGSEPRYDGENMARNKSIVTVTANYRLDVFGFLAYPGLTKESPHHASGDYGLLDQVQVLRWVQKNIVAFGGDPDKVTIEGQSAGSLSISGLMASPLSRNLFRGAMGESGAFFGPAEAPIPLSKAEKKGVKFAKVVGAHSLAELRAMPASKLLTVARKKSSPRFGVDAVDIDGYFLPKSPAKIFSAGEQAHVPLLLGWNSQEKSGQVFLKGKSPTLRNFIKMVKKDYCNHANKILSLFPHSTKKQVEQSATHLAGDRFTVFSTWKWSELQSKTSGKPVYRYYYAWPRPKPRAKSDKNFRDPGAVHSAEIEYVMGNLPITKREYDWQPIDYKVSHIFQDYVSNFVKTGDPNGLGLPVWVPLNKGHKHYVMHIGINTYLRPSKQRKQHLYLDKLYKGTSE